MTPTATAPDPELSLTAWRWTGQKSDLPQAREFLGDALIATPWSGLTEFELVIRKGRSGETARVLPGWWLVRDSVGRVFTCLDRHGQPDVVSVPGVPAQPAHAPRPETQDRAAQALRSAAADMASLADPHARTAVINWGIRFGLDRAAEHLARLADAIEQPNPADRPEPPGRGRAGTRDPLLVGGVTIQPPPPTHASPEYVQALISGHERRRRALASAVGHDWPWESLINAMTVALNSVAYHRTRAEELARKLDAVTRAAGEQPDGPGIPSTAELLSRTPGGGTP